ncbi:MAG: hypothetical protein AB8C84_13200 [Oligoflexales bacterium]
MKFFILLSFLLTTSCAKKSSVRKPTTEASLDGITKSSTAPSTKNVPGNQNTAPFDGDLEQAQQDVANSPLGDIIGDSELVTGIDATQLGSDQVLVEENGDITLPNPPPGLSLADSEDDVEVEVIKNDDGSQESIVKDAKTGKVIATEKTSASGTTIIQVEIDPATNQPVSEETIELSPTKKDNNGNAIVISRVIKIFYPDGSILSETTYGEAGTITNIVYYNNDGAKTREEVIGADGSTVTSEIIYNDDGTRQETTWDPNSGEAVVTQYDANGNQISQESIVSAQKTSSLIDQSGKFINRIAGFYKATTWNVKKLGDSSDGESCDSCSRKRQIPMQPYQEQNIHTRDEKGYIVRDENGFPEQKTVYPAYCGLTKVLFNDVHGDSEHTGCGIGKYAANNRESNIETRDANAAYDGLYALETWKNNDSDAYCEAMCWQLETALQPFPNTIEVEKNNREKIIDDPDGRKFCFLDKVQFTNLDKSDGPGSCRVYRDETEKAWYVESKTFKKAQAVCRPGCFDIGEGYVAVEVEEIIAARANGKADHDDYKKHTEAANSNTTYRKDEEKDGTNALSTVCGLTGVLIADIDDGKEVFNCKLTGGNYTQEQTWKDFIQNREAAGLDELANKKLKWTLWAGLNGGDDDDTFDPLSADGKVNGGLVQGDYSDNGQDQYGECRAICFQVKHDCDGDGKADKDIHEVCPL